MNQTKSPDIGLLEYAAGRGFVFSEDISEGDLLDAIFERLESIDRIAFFCFSIYRFLSGDSHTNLDMHPKRSVFYSFAQMKESDRIFTKSMNTYSGADLQVFGRHLGYDDTGRRIVIDGASTKTSAFKAVALYLNPRFGTPSTLRGTRELTADGARKPKVTEKLSGRRQVIAQWLVLTPPVYGGFFFGFYGFWIGLAIGIGWYMVYIW